LDPLLSEAHQAMGAVHARDGQWAHSEKSFRRAMALEPSNSLAYSDLTYNILLPLGRIEEAIHEMQIAEKTDPLSPWVQSGLASALLSTGRYEEAANHCEKAADTRCLGRARLAQGRIDEAIQILATGSGPQYLGYAYGRAGRREEAEKLAAAAAPNAFTQALTFAGLGDKERTLEALDRLASLGAVRVGRALNSPEFALLRGDLRIKALRKRVGLPE
jgi:tetratricopeptide (TPR) repeat protein